MNFNENVIRQFENKITEYRNWVCEDLTPEVGKQFNAIESIGFWLINGFRLSVSHWKNTADKDVLGRIGSVALAIVTSPATIAGLAIREIGRALPHPVNIRTDDVYGRSSKHLIDELYEVFSAVNTVAKEKNIPYFACGGTVLGLARHGGIIPWDDDVDLNVDISHADKLPLLMAELEKRGFTTKYNSTLQQYQVHAKNPHDPNHIGTLDIIITKKIMDPKLGEIHKPASDFFQAQFSREFYTDEEVKNIQEFSFGPVEKGLKISCIKDMKSYVTRYYGKNCLDVGLKTHDHILLFGFIPLFLPQLNIEAVQIVDKNCAQGNNWTGTSQLPELE